MNPTPNLPDIILQKAPFSLDSEAVWLGTSMILRRNLAGHHFPSKLATVEKQEMIHTISAALEKVGIPHVFDQKDLLNQAKELIYEHFLFLHGLDEPPDGFALALDPTGEFLILINAEDHLEMHPLCPSNQWEKPWQYLSHVDNELSKQFGYAYSPKFGYLTSYPSQCGTGLTLSAYLHLPALIHTNQLEKVLQPNDEITYLSLSGNPMQPIGDLIIVQNNYSLGVSEENIFHSIQMAATKLISAEKGMRNHLKENPNGEIKDLISKAFGLLVHSYQLETKEALDLLSMMKLGLSLKEIDQVTEEKLTTLLWQCRRGFLMHLSADLKDPEAIAKKRATYLQEQLAGIRLTSEVNE